jgi:hypothetical protein
MRMGTRGRGDEKVNHRDTEDTEKKEWRANARQAFSVPSVSLC